MVRKRPSGIFGCSGEFSKIVQVEDKIEVLNNYFKDKNITSENVLYMGDDIPDYYAMQECGVATCPKDAAVEIKEIVHYISDKNGGEGCVRDIIEQVMRCKGDWFNPQA